jgi:hypothetical protein
METSAGKIFPNLFVMLVARPGVGKSLIVNPVLDLWKSCPLLKVGSQTMTYASYIDETKSAFTERTLGNSSFKSSALLLGASEFGSLTPTYDQSLLTRMADIYDGRDEFDSSTRGGEGIIKLYAPLVHILVGITPKFLGSVVPDTAWQQGFMARFHILYSDEHTKLTREQMFFPQKIIEEKNRLKAIAVKKLLKICHFYGEFTWEKEAADLLFNWANAGMPPVPTHPKLETYSTRRFVHCVKMCMIIAASSFRHVISISDFSLAKHLLLSSEETLADTFVAMNQTAEAEQVDQIYHWLIQQIIRVPQGIPMAAFQTFLGTIVGVHMLERMYNHLIVSDVIRINGDRVTPGERANG